MSAENAHKDLTRAAACPRNVASPLAGMCGGGSSGGSGGFTAGLLSVFLLVSFRWLRGEELEELPELVTVSPELQATRDACLLQLQLTKCDASIRAGMFSTRSTSLVKV